MTNNDVTYILSNLKDKEKIRILFVCLGNICRSPAAHGIMQSIVDANGNQARFEIDSAGLYGGHAGDLPDNRMRVHARRRGYELTHRARQVRESDFSKFDLIIAMDDSNYQRLHAMAPTVDEEKKVVRMADFVNQYPFVDHIPDPYYDGAEGFERVLDLLEDGCANLYAGLSE
ncbi:MAG: low molecular weight phosphotyrosine protein phosphatase [Muribaculaceae bacterium]|nr:low molecular weight phosphotyrosine protein phosphatase [Muribaculaceae bacterium]